MNKPLILDELWYHELFNSAVESIIAVNKNGLILSATPNMLKLFEFELENIIGADMGLIIHDSIGGVTFEGYLEKLNATNEGVMSHDFVGVRKGGQQFPITVVMTELRYKQEVRTILSIQDNSAKEIYRSHMEKHELMLSQSQYYSGIGHWHYNLLSQSFELSSNAKEILGVHCLSNQVLLNDLLSLIDEEYKSVIPDAIEQCIQGIKIDIKVKLMPRDGVSVYVELKGGLEANNIKPSMIHGVIHYANSKGSNHTNELSLGYILENSQDEIYIIDCKTLLFSEVNKLARSHLGYSMTELRNMHLYDIFPRLRNDECKLLWLESDNVKTQTTCQQANGSHYVVELKMQKMNYDQSEVYIVFSEDLTERESRASEVFLAKEEADRANKAKSDFLSRMSHELRTPMNAILGFAQLMEADQKEPLNLEHQDDLHEIRKAGGHLLTLINDVLDLSTIESETVSISIETVDLSSLVSEICTLARPIAESYGIAVNNDVSNSISQKSVCLSADRVRLKQVLLNLVSNAIKYGSEGGDIIINFHIDSMGRGVVNIIDRGPGLSESQSQSVFMPFNRLNAAETNVEGTGIGLTIAKELAELMGGDIGVNSREGEGCTFWVALPLSTEPAENEERISDKLNLVDHSIIGSEQQVILYIEDNPANSKLVERLISKHTRYRYIHASTASLGMELAKAHNPNLILMDIHLPGISGIQAKYLMDEDIELASIPVIAVSASASQGDIAEATRAGFVDYIVKPFQLDVFLNIAIKYLEVPCDITTSD